MEMSQACTEASHAIIVISERYLASPYCLQEYRLLYDADTPTIGLIVDDVSIDDLQTAITVDDWIDFRNVDDRELFRKKTLQIADLLSHIDNASPMTERDHYIHQLLGEIEGRLAETSTSRAIPYETVTIGENQLSIRPRGYDVTLLREWHLTSQVNQAQLNVEDVLVWYDTQQQIVLVGEAGSGKTVLASMLTLLALHDARLDADLPPPVWFDLALWTGNQSLEEYVESWWPLAFYWKEWLNKNHGLLVFDNFADLSHLNAFKVDELRQWIGMFSQHKVIIVARDKPDSLQFPAPIVQIGEMQNTNIQRFGRAFLHDDQISVFKRLVFENKDRLSQRNIAFISCGIELISSQNQTAVDNWFKNPIEALILERWRAHFGDTKPPFSSKYFVQALRILAWHMMQQPYEFMINIDTAEEVVFRKAVISTAVTFGILDVVGNYVRFHAQMYATYLSIHHLVQDGLYAHITHPRFDKDGQRIGTRWDDVVVALIDTTEGERQAQIIKHIAEIDPYLIHSCIQPIPQLFDNYFQMLVDNMIELRSVNSESHTAMTRAFRQMPDMSVVALTLLNQLQLYNWHIQQWFWLEFLKLPVDLPVAFIQSIRKLDREFEDTMFDLLSDYEHSELMIYLAQLIAHQDSAVRLNAIWLVGRLRYENILIGLLNLLDHHTVQTCKESLDAMSRITTGKDKLLDRLLKWIEQYPNHAGIIGTVLYQNGRHISGRLLMECQSNEVPMDPQFLEMLRSFSEEELGIDIATYLVAIDPDLQQLFDFVETDETDEMNIQKLLQVSLEQLPRESLNKFLEDIQRVLVSDEPTSETELVAQRAHSAIEASRPPSEDAVKPAGSIDDIQQKLGHDDWLVRLHATESLGALPSEQALSLILQSTEDEDAQVRVTAYNLLANFAEHDHVQQKLIDGLTDDESMVVDFVTDLLKSRNILDTPTLIALLQTENIQQLAAVLDILCTRPDSDALPHLVPFLDDQRKSWMDKSISDYVRDAIRAIGTPEALGILEESPASENSDLETFVSQNAESTQKKTYTTVEKFALSLKVLRGGDWGRAQKVARYIRELAQKMRGTQNDVVVQLLCGALSDEHWHVRWAVAEALGWLQDPQALPYLVNTLNDDHWIVQVAVIRGLVEIGASDYVADIAVLLENPNNVVRETAVEALGDIGNAEAIPYLRRTLVHEDDFVRMASIKALQLLQGETNTEHLRTGLNDSYIHVRWYAMEQLSPYFTVEDIPLLADLLNDNGKPAWEDKHVCDLAHEALQKLNTNRAHQVINEWQSQNSGI